MTKARGAFLQLFVVNAPVTEVSSLILNSKYGDYPVTSLTHISSSLR
jgi:hypothetical protein